MTLFAPPEQHLDPYAFYAERRRDRLAHDPDQDAWAVYRHADVKAVLMDFANFSSEVPSEEIEGFRESLITVDPPRHRNLRGLLSKAFTPQAIARLEPRIRSLSDELLEALDDSGRFDLVSQFAHPLPVTVIAELLGVPVSDQPQYKRWADELLNGEGPALVADEARRLRAQAIQGEMDDYFRAVIVERRRRPADDLISQLLVAEIDGERLDEEAVLSFCALLLLAGHITTVNLITNGMLCLVDEPRATEWLREHPEAMPLAVEEMLRYRSPVQWLPRRASRDLVLGGERLRKGQLVVAFIGSANRDEAVFAEPERFAPDRQPNPHLSFGHGVHYCLGAPLARLEGVIALRALLARYPAFALDLAPGEELVPASSSLIHGVARLPMRVPVRLVS